MELSLPRWLYEMWSREYGEERTAAMARSFLKEGVTTIRVKPEKKQEAIESLKKQGAAVEEDCLVPGIFYLKDYDYLEGLEAFQKGWLQVQDLSSALVGALVPPMEDQPGAGCVCGAGRQEFTYGGASEGKRSGGSPGHQ